MIVKFKKKNASNDYFLKCHIIGPSSLRKHTEKEIFLAGGNVVLVIYRGVRGQLRSKTKGCDQQPNKHVVQRLGQGDVHRASIKLHLQETDTVASTHTSTLR